MPFGLEQLRLQAPDARSGTETAVVSALFAALAIGTTALVINGAYFGLITALILRSAFFSLVSSAGLLFVGLRARNSGVRWACYALAAVALVPGAHLWQSYIDIVMRGAMATEPDLWIFVGLMAVVLVLVRMALGWALVILVVAALAYAWFGDLIPGKYGHGGYDLRRLTSTLMLSTEGIYGLPMGVAVEYIFLFALLGLRRQLYQRRWLARLVLIGALADQVDIPCDRLAVADRYLPKYQRLLADGLQRLQHVAGDVRDP